MPEGIVHIRKGREKPINNEHPWVFSGSVYNTENADPGDIVTLLDYKKNFLGRGYWNPKSAIQVRILTWQDETIDESWWRHRLRQSIKRRYPTPQQDVGNRVINAENDYIPGLIVDRYADYLVLQALTLHIDQHKHDIATYLADIFEALEMPIKGIYERSDVDVRGKEGLEQTTGLLWGDAPPQLIEFYEGKNVRLVDVRFGHKTGYYLDQVKNHDLASRLSMNDKLPSPTPTQLNAFSYTGGFGIASLATTINVDTSQDALDLAEQTYEANGFPMSEVEFVQEDVFEYLREAQERGEMHDLVILDPPKFAHHKGQVQSAARGYKDINLNAFKIVKPGGYLMTFSCSGAIDRDLFQKIVFGALADSGRTAQIMRHLGAADDHPIALTFPEGEYLKGLLLRVY